MDVMKPIDQASHRNYDLHDLWIQASLLLAASAPGDSVERVAA